MAVADAVAGPDWAELRKSIEPLLSMTIDQLSTYVAICDKKSVRQAALAINRDQSSVDKQLQTMERNFEGLTNGKLVCRSKQRGGQIDLTRSGVRVRQLAAEILQLISRASNDLQKLQQNYTIRIALTTFMIPLLTEVQGKISERFASAGVKLTRELRHVWPTDVQSSLLRDEVDFCFGAVISKTGQSAPVKDGLEFAEWGREELVLLSNSKDLGAAVSVRDLSAKRLPLILPVMGIIRDFIEASCQDLTTLNIVETCNDSRFGIDLLRLSTQPYCMICPQTIAGQAKDLPNGKRLREVKLNGSNLQVSIGLFRRRGECEHHNEGHPLRMFWDVFASLAENRHSKM